MKYTILLYIYRHGRGKYGDNLSTNWFLTSLTDENIEGVSKEPINDNHFGKYCFPLGDGTYLIYNIKDNKIAQSYHGDWAGRFSDSAVKAVRPHNGFARARDLRNNPYFKEGRNKIIIEMVGGIKRVLLKL